MMPALMSLPAGYLFAIGVYVLVGLAVYLYVFRSARRRKAGRLLVGGSLLFAEGWLLAIGALWGAFIIAVSAGAGGDAVASATIALVVGGTMVLGGIGLWILVSVLAMRGNRLAARVGTVLSWLCAGYAFASSDYDLLPKVALTVALALPSIFLLVGLVAADAVKPRAQSRSPRQRARRRQQANQSGFPCSLLWNRVARQKSFLLARMGPDTAKWLDRALLRLREVSR